MKTTIYIVSIILISIAILGQKESTWTFENKQQDFSYPSQSAEKTTRHAVFTSYSSGDGYTPGTVMASGKKVYVGAVACPRDMALGTVIEVDGRRLTCEARKALRFDWEFDIYAAGIDEALEFGRKELAYSIID